MDQTRSGLILGFHGCDEKIRDGIVMRKIAMRKSENNYDWLGHGFYFWENNEDRAFEFAGQQQRKAKIERPAVLGAVIDLGFCLDLMDSRYLKLVKEFFFRYANSLTAFDRPLPQNKGGSDLLVRNLDCAVLEYLHSHRANEGLRPFDSVRGVFQEGGELYPNAGFREKTHVQICIRNPACLRGFFMPE